MELRFHLISPDLTLSALSLMVQLASSTKVSLPSLRCFALVKEDVCTHTHSHTHTSVHPDCVDCVTVCTIKSYVQIYNWYCLLDREALPLTQDFQHSKNTGSNERLFLSENIEM